MSVFEQHEAKPERNVGQRIEKRPVMRYSTALSGLLNAARIAFAT